jgi:hypothetical protein
MIAELAKGYRGVPCRWCHAAIPVSATVATLEEVETSESSAPRAFTARCRVCDGESVYAVSDIRTLEGEPRRRTTRARAAGA